MIYIAWWRVFSAVVAIVGLVLIAVSPSLIEYLGKEFILDADYVSKIGSSYGAVSALISAVSLLILSVGSVLQYRQTKIAQLQSARTMQFELLKIALENAAYRHALGEELGDKSAGEWRAHAYQNLWLMHFQMCFLTGSIAEAGLRAWLAREFFRSDKGRGFWREIRSAAESEVSTRKHRVFFSIVDDEHRKAVNAIAGSSLPTAN